MSNPSMVSFLAILVILATAVWRTITGRAKDGYRTIWAAGLVAVGLGFLTDLSAGTGAAISGAVLLFFIIRGSQGSPSTWTAPAPNGASSAPAAPAGSAGGSTSSGGSGNTGGGSAQKSSNCPSGFFDPKTGKCIQISMN